MANDDGWRSGAQDIYSARNVACHTFHGVGFDGVGLVRAPVAPHVHGRRGKTGRGDGAHLMAPRIPGLRKAVDHQHKRPCPLHSNPDAQGARVNSLEFLHEMFPSAGY